MFTYLFVDDMMDRHRAFSNFVASRMAGVAQGDRAYTIVHAFDYDSAVRAMRDGVHYTAVWLDHDLSLDPVAPAKDGTDLARWISETKSLRCQRVMLHSMNEAGRARMQSLLLAAEYPVESRPYHQWVDLWLLNTEGTTP